MDATLPDGVYTVLPTPFRDDGSVDHPGLRDVVGHVLDEGTAAVVCFGLASELYKLDDDERARILDTVIETVDGRVPIVAGSESNAIESAVRRTRATVEAGADAVMALPPSFVRPDPATTVAYYVEVAAAAGDRPVIVQDAPAWTGVPLPVEVLADARSRASNLSCAKVENPPNAAKIRALTEVGFRCIGGLGGLHLMEDRAAGVHAVMTGAGTVARDVALWAALEEDPDEAWAQYTRILPLLVFQMSSIDTFVAVQKELLLQRGVLGSAALRRPGQTLDARQRAWLSGLVERTGGMPS